MPDTLKLAQLYLDLSNKSDFKGIEKLFSNSTTYASQTTGSYLGKTDIIAMQKSFHGRFSALNWKVLSTKEVKPGTILFDYEFTGLMPDGEKIKSSGLEYITVSNGKIQDIKIQNKE